MYKYLLIFFLLLNLQGYSQKRKLKQADTFFELAEKYRIEKNDDSASVFYGKAAEIYKKNKKYIKAVKSYREAAWAFCYLPEKAKAFESIQQSLFIANNNFNKNNQDELVEWAKTYYCFGFIELGRNNFDKSIDLYTKAIEYLAAKEEKDIIIHKLIAKYYVSLSYIYSTKGDLEKAIKCGEKSLEINYKTSGLNDFLTSYTYLNVGACYLKINDYERAIEYFNIAREIQLNTKGDSTEFMAMLFSNMGTAYFNKEDYKNAFKYFISSKNIYLKINKQDSKWYISILNNLGEVYKVNGDYENALVLHEQALKAYWDLFGDKDEYIALTFRFIGDVLSLMGKTEMAIHKLDTAITINKQLFGFNHPEIVNCYNRQGEIYLGQENYVEALACFKKAISSNIPFIPLQDSILEFPELNNSFVLSKPLLFESLERAAFSFFQLYKETNHIKRLKSSIHLYNKAVGVLDLIRRDLKAVDSKMLVNSQKKTSLNGALIAAFEYAQNVKDSSYLLHGFMEKSKSAAMRSLLSETKAKKFSDIPVSWVEKEKQMKVDINYYHNLIQKSIYNEEIKKEEIDAWKNKKNELVFEFDTLIKYFEEQYPEYYKIKYDNSVAGIKDIQSVLSEEDAILNYYMAEQVLYIELITDRLNRTIKMPVNSLFKELVMDYYFNIKKGENHSFLQNSQELYKILIEPIQNEIKNKKELIIIPDDNLFYIPFETLIDSVNINNPLDKLGNLDYLVKKYKISYNYSATIWYNQQIKRNYKNENTKKSFVGFAPFLNINSKGQDFNELYFSKPELDTLVYFFKNTGYHATGFYGENATENMFKKNIRHYNYIHIATHGIYNDQNPEMSYLAFSSNKNDSTDDRKLYANEMYNLDLSCDLIVLSACKTGMGKLVKGEGLISMNRGLLYSGSPNILFSLWDVSDKHTKDLMIYFYKNIILGLDIPNALRNAKLKILKENNKLAPYFWSAFILLSS